MPDVYYVGDMGDLVNVDWFFVGNGRCLPNVTFVKIQMHTGTVPRLWATIHYSGGAVADGEVVPNPHLTKNGTVTPAPARRSTTGAFKKGDIVWHATRGSEWVKSRVIGVGMVTLQLIRLLNSQTFEADATDVTKCEPEATHRCDCDAEPGERHHPHCAGLYGVNQTQLKFDIEKSLGLPPTEPTTISERSEAERMRDFFRGKDTW